MSSDVVQADYEKLEQIAKQFQRAAGEHKQIVQSLQQHAELLRIGWIGKGSEAFHQEMNTVIFPSMQRLVGSLDNASNVTRQIAETIQAAEAEAASLFAHSSEGEDGFAPNPVFKAEETIRITGNETVSGASLFAKGVGDSTDIHPNDVVQVGLGDCYLAASVIAIASRNPELIRKAIRANKDGDYTVTLYRKKRGFLGIGGGYEKVNIVVKPTFPKGDYYDAKSKRWYPTQLDVGPGDKELWPRLIEKAYGQLITKSSDVGKVYNRLNQGGHPGDVLSAITGTDSKFSAADHYSIKELAALQKSNHVMVLSSLPGDKKSGPRYRDDSLTRNHAYWIESIDVANKKVIVRNPWGYDSSKQNRIEMDFDDLGANFHGLTVTPLNRK